MATFEHAHKTGHPPTQQEKTAVAPSWVKNQRRARNDALQVAFLDSIPGWDWNPRDSSWERNFDQLMQFSKQHRRRPHINAIEERTLAYWTNRQVARMNAYPKRYPADRRQRLLQLLRDLDR